jgi:serpin B
MDGLREFSVAFARASEASGNLVFSPLSIAAAFAMAAAGATEATYADLARVFGFPPPAELHPAMAAVLSEVDTANNDDVTVQVADAIWSQVGLVLGPAFVESLAADYGAGLQAADFIGDLEGARQAINAWVAKVTRGRIDPLLQPGSLDPAVEVVLVNAIYLFARWQRPFDKALTQPRPFAVADGIKVDVPMMHAPNWRLAATIGPDAVAVKLPYVGNELAMVVIVADDLATIDGPVLAEVLGRLTPRAVALSLPKWDIASTLDLSVPLGALGFPIPGGDFAGIAPGAFIGAAVHAANITVDETSTEAAAATAVMVGRAAFDPAEPTPIVVDRPFLFVVQHEATGVPLFYGRVTDPRNPAGS